MEGRVHGDMAEQHLPVGQGVQIRFIDDLKENKKARSVRSRHDSYGVAIRVQGIDGQPFVVLNSGDQAKSSYGVQIKTNNAYGNSTPEYQGLSAKASRTVRSVSSESELPENPYGGRTYPQSGSHYSSTSDEEQSSRPRSKPRALQPARREELRRSQSHGSLMDAEVEDSYDGHYSERSSTLDTSYSQSSDSLRKAAAGEAAVGKYKPATSQQPTSFSSSLQRKSRPSVSPSPQLPSADVDTKPLSSVDSLINKFDNKVQMRGRTARKSQALRDERKRSQSLDGRKPRQDTADYREVQTAERSLQQERAPPSDSRAALEREGINKTRLTKEWLAQTLEEPVAPTQQRTVQLKSTPDLLKDQQQDDPTRELVYSILRDGSNENDAFLRKKTSLLLEKIQPFQASPGEDTRTLLSQKKELERRVSELQQQLDDEMKLRMRQEAARPKASTQRLEIQLEEALEESKKLKELLERKKEELNSTAQELIEVRMSKEQVETKLRSLEGKLQDTKEEVNQLRLKGTTGDKHALLKELQELQDELDAVLQIRHKQDDLLRQKERELTALKGALKDEVANHDQEMERVRQQYQSDMQQLRKNMDNVSQDQLSLESERQKINQVVRNLQRELEESSEEITQWKEMFQKNKEELRKAKEEVLQLRLEKEEFEDEVSEVKTRFSLVQTELEQVRKGSADPREAEATRKEVQRLQEQVQPLMQEKQRLEETLRQRDRELSALKGALKDEVSGHDYDLQQLREQFSREMQQSKKEYEDHMQELQKFQDQVKPLMQEKQRLEESLHQRDRELTALKGALQDEVSGHGREAKLREQFTREHQEIKRDYEELVKAKIKLENEKAEQERMRQVIENNLQDSRDEGDDLRRKILGLEAQVKELKTFCDDLQRAETRLKDKMSRMETERRRMEESLGEATDQGQEFAVARRDLESRLDEAQRNLKRLTLEYDELQECYQEEIRQKDQLKKTKNELEEQKRLLDKAMDKLTRELDKMSGESRESLELLQTQLEEYREKSRREVSECQRQAKEKATEAERLQLSISRLQEEVQRLKQALQESLADKENVELDRELLAQRLQSLEQDMDSKKRFQDDRSRQVKVLEDKVKRLEVELDEEKNSVELLTDRVNRSRDQMEQLRAELMQERTSRQDLECDKISLERQNKDLKNRLAGMEGQQKPSANVSLLEAKLQEVQERLQLEEREKNTLLSSTRKLERKLKELNIQLEDERLQVNDQKDQLNLKVKALKRQMDEAEEEIERLEALRKKAQRELEEQHEINEQLQGRLKALEKEARRKPVRPAADDDDLSSDGDYDGSYNPSSIASLLTESNLQTSSC